MEAPVGMLPVPPKRSAVKDAVAETSRLMGKRGTLSVLICSLLFCLMATFALFGLVLFAATLCTQLPLTEWGYYMVDTLLIVVFCLLFWLFAMPLWLGRLRMAGLLWQDGIPLAKELFYYYTSFRRLRRAWRIGFMLLMEALIPLLVLYLLFDGIIYLHDEILLYQATKMTADMIGYLLLLGLLPAAAILLLLAGFSLLSAGIAVGNESMRVRDALWQSMCAGKRHFGTVTRFTLRSVPWLLLGLVTVGVVQLLYFSHFYILSYLRLCMALCPKEDDVQ